MHRTPRAVIMLLATATLLGGCGRVTQASAQPAFAPAKSGPAAPRLQQYTADDSVCRWSAPACPGAAVGG